MRTVSSARTDNFPIRSIAGPASLVIVPKWFIPLAVQRISDRVSSLDILRRVVVCESSMYDECLQVVMWM